MNEQKKAAIVSKILACFDACKLKDGAPVFSSFYAEIVSLSKELEKDHSPYIEFDQTLDLIWNVIRTMLKDVADENRKNSGKLTDLVGIAVLTEHANSLVEFSQTFPREYFLFFRLPQVVSGELPFVSVTQDVSVVTVLDYGTQTQGTLSSLALGRLSPLVDGEIGPGTYVKIRVVGYNDQSLESYTLARGLALFKQFVYLCILGGRLELKQYYSPWGSKVVGSLQILDSKLKPTTANAVAISDELGRFISMIKCVDSSEKNTDKDEKIGLLSMLVPNKKNEIISERWAKVLASDDENENSGSFKNALEWAFDSLANKTDQTLAFIQISIALEAILGIDTKRDGGLTNQLADRAAHMVGNSVSSRKEIRKKFVAFYDVRSKLVHGRDKRLSNKDQIWFFWGRNLLDKILKRELLLSDLS